MLEKKKKEQLKALTNRTSQKGQKNSSKILKPDNQKKKGKANKQRFETISF